MLIESYLKNLHGHADMVFMWYLKNESYRKTYHLVPTQFDAKALSYAQ